jgi:hypothetical protein
MTGEWGAARRVTFRFAFTYLVLYELPFILKRPLPPAARPEIERVASFEPVVRWFGQHVLGVAGGLPMDLGGGDSTFQWVRIAFLATVATVSTLVWSTLDRRRKGYPTLFEALRIYVRYGLAFTMLFYGMVKVLPVQFELPWLNRLLEPFGDASPMGLLWTFMGFSRPYTFFTGLVETAGACCLFWRRTTLVGALVLAGSLVNVVALNFSYDVAVKLRSIHLLWMAIFLIVPDAFTLVRLFLLRQKGSLRWRALTLPGHWLGHARPWVKAVLIALCSWMTIKFARQSAHRERHPPPLYGRWLVESGRPLPGGDAAWHHVIVNEWNEVEIERLDDTRIFYDDVEEDRSESRLTFAGRQGRITFTCEHPDADHLVLGTGSGEAAVVLQLRREKRDFLLTSRGFHWIQDAYLNQ